MIQVPKSLTRPTTDKVRQAIFSMLGEHVPDARVLDLFAGSGAMGLEALSRGASSALFVDEQRAACDVIKANLTRTKLSGGQIRAADVLRLLPELERQQPAGFDIVFADPPYKHERADRNWAQDLLDSEALPKAMSSEASFILETSKSTLLNIPPERWELVRERDYGDTRVLWLRKANPHADA